MSSLPPFPVDEATLDLLSIALDPGPESQGASVWDFLTLMSQLGGSDTDAVESVETVAGLPDLAPDLVDGDEGSYEVNVMRDPHYHEHDVMRALIAEIRRLRKLLNGEDA